MNSELVGEIVILIHTTLPLIGDSQLTDAGFGHSSSTSIPGMFWFPRKNHSTSDHLQISQELLMYQKRHLSIFEGKPWFLLMKSSENWWYLTKSHEQYEDITKDH